ncbi:hypothetical protein P5673_014727 [Acropora cervicornis]|uniref:Uncharacterized protein n=1 Tax=Acropora cervicornis TaxID=6130 RepID=A0AAD9QIK7_ACRCE|nr:hypothetical protein P5673_014727 [Acropora cervicornis]
MKISFSRTLNLTTVDFSFSFLKTKRKENEFAKMTILQCLISNSLTGSCLSPIYILANIEDFVPSKPHTQSVCLLVQTTISKSTRKQSKKNQQS